jgi:hypothetical protein
LKTYLAPEDSAPTVCCIFFFLFNLFFIISQSLVSMEINSQDHKIFRIQFCFLLEQTQVSYQIIM